MARLIVFLVLLAVVVYAVFWLIDRRNEAGGHKDDPDGGQLRRPRGPVGPDDDEEFLRELERRRRHDQGEV